MIQINGKLIQKIFKEAVHAQRKAYAPYSKFYVGSAVLTESGEIYSGANVENASYGGTICAERFAIGKAINAGQEEIRAIAVVTPTKKGASPCGICLQFLSEFASPETIVIVGGKGGIEYAIPF